MVTKSILRSYGDEICSYCLCLSVELDAVGFSEAGVMWFSTIDQFAFEKRDVRVKVSLYEVLPISQDEKHNP